MTDDEWMRSDELGATVLSIWFVGRIVSNRSGSQAAAAAGDGHTLPSFAALRFVVRPL